MHRVQPTEGFAANPNEPASIAAVWIREFHHSRHVVGCLLTATELENIVEQLLWTARSPDEVTFVASNLGRNDVGS